MNSIAFQNELNKKRMHSSCKRLCSVGIMKKPTSHKLLNEILKFLNIKIHIFDICK